MEALVALLQHEDLTVQRAAASTFVKLDKSVQEQHLEALVALLQHEDCVVRSAAACAFGQVGAGAACGGTSGTAAT